MPAADFVAAGAAGTPAAVVATAAVGAASFCFIAGDRGGQGCSKIAWSRCHKTAAFTGLLTNIACKKTSGQRSQTAASGPSVGHVVNLFCKEGRWWLCSALVCCACLRSQRSRWKIYSGRSVVRGPFRASTDPPADTACRSCSLSLYLPTAIVRIVECGSGRPCRKGERTNRKGLIKASELSVACETGV